MPFGSGSKFSLRQTSGLCPAETPIPIIPAVQHRIFFASPTVAVLLLTRLSGDIIVFGAYPFEEHDYAFVSLASPSHSWVRCVAALSARDICRLRRGCSA